MTNRFRNTVLFIAGTIVIAAMLGAPSTARANGVAMNNRTALHT